MTLQERFNIALERHKAGRIPEAERYYRQILAEQASHADALHMLGVIAYQQGRFDAAVELIRHAIAINSHAGHYYCNLGLAFSAMGRYEEAAAAYLTSLKLDGGASQTYYNLGNAMRDLRQPAEAVAAYQKSLTLRPDNVEAATNMGSVLRSIGQVDEAIAAYRQALARKPDHFEAVHNLANALKDKGEFDAAISNFHTAAAIHPEHPALLQNLGHTLYSSGDLDQAIACYDRAATLMPDDAAMASQRLFALTMHPDYDAQRLLAEHKKWGERFGRQAGRRENIRSSVHDENRPLKIGYVSGDFFDHVVGWNMLWLLNRHDRSRFVIYCYSNVARPDHVTQKLSALADGWRDIKPLNDEQAARMIAEDGIDILVDLSVHTSDNRLPLMALKPAPVQATYLGALGTTGLDAIDYRFSDSYIDPPDADLSDYTERTIRLKSYWCYSPGSAGEAPDVVESPAIKNGYVTFGCLGSITKVSRPALETFGNLLAAVKESRFIFNCPPGSSRERAMRQLSGHGISPDRVEFVRNQPWAKYMATYQRIDVALDPFPYGGGITTCDGLWMGVPVITLCGRTAAGRGGKSILSSLGLAEWIAESREEYVRLAMQWRRMIELRPTMRERMRLSPLMDGKGFIQDLEAGYRRMWQERNSPQPATTRKEQRTK